MLKIMAKKLPKKKTIYGIDHYQLAWLEVNPSTDRYVYNLTPNDLFDEELCEGAVSKTDYIALYESWSDNDKIQINILISLLNSDIRVKRKRGKDPVGEFCEFSVENNLERYLIKLYGPSSFLSYLNVMYSDRTLFKPGSTIDSLYTEALKQD